MSSAHTTRYRKTKLGAYDESLEPYSFSNRFFQVFRERLEHAALIAMKNDAELHVLHVRVPFTDGPIASLEKDFPEHERFQEVFDRLARTNMESVKPRVDISLTKKVISAFDTATAVAEYAEKHDIDLVVVGTHGRKALGHLLLGSVAERVFRLSPVSVLAVGHDAAHRLQESAYRKVLVPVDFSDGSRRALQHAAAICTQHHAELIVLHVIDHVPHPAYYMSGHDSIMDAFPDITHRSREMLAEWVKPYAELQTDTLVGEGRAHVKIAEVAREHNVNIIVMGAQGLSGIGRLLLGSVTERTLRSAPCPVLADKSKEAANV
ncbi:MAG: universal stress protein [Myxococcota bacterium]